MEAYKTHGGVAPIPTVVRMFILSRGVELY